MFIAILWICIASLVKELETKESHFLVTQRSDLLIVLVDEVHFYLSSIRSDWSVVAFLGCSYTRQDQIHRRSQNFRLTAGQIIVTRQSVTYNE